MNGFREWFQTGASSGRPLILAHRGDSFHAPENTMEAARRGLESGADAWELDVRMTSDGHLVVIHDESLVRTTDVATRFARDPRDSSGYRVGQFTLEEVRSLDAGSWFVDESSSEPRSARGFGTLDRVEAEDLAHFRSRIVRVPTLDEALAWTRDVEWLVNVEIKTATTEPEILVKSVLDAIERTETWNRVSISSFEHKLVEAVTKLDPRVATGALIAGPLDQRTEAWVEACGIDAVHGPPWFAPPRASCPRLVYTVNDAASGGLAEKLANDGVTGLFTDDPRTMTRLFAINRF